MRSAAVSDRFATTLRQKLHDVGTGELWTNVGARSVARNNPSEWETVK
jgi:hypothetical protein